MAQVKFGNANYVNDEGVREAIAQMKDDPTKFLFVSNEMHGELLGSNPDISERIFDLGSNADLRAQLKDTLDMMSENPVDMFAVGAETYDQISESAPDMVDQLIDMGPDYLLVDGITDGLDTLSSNLGIDVPDGVGDIIPYAGAVIAGARLVYSVLKTENEFKAVDRTTKNKIQVIQSLTLMSRIGVTTALATAGGMGGGAVGSIVPGIGNLVGGIVGSLGGAGMGMYLNRHLQPHMLNLALNITGMTNDDLFYYKNKVRIDNVALSYQERAIALAAPA